MVTSPVPATAPAPSAPTATKATRKGRFKDLTERVPIHIITTRAALVGAAIFGLQSLSELKNREEAKASLASVLVRVTR